MHVFTHRWRSSQGDQVSHIVLLFRGRKIEKQIAHLPVLFKLLSRLPTTTEQSLDDMIGEEVKITVNLIKCLLGAKVIIINF